jgi:hypothetical protein
VEKKDRFSIDVRENTVILKKKLNMKNASKLYKTHLNKSYCEYQDKTEEEITIHWTTYLATCIDFYIYICL